MQEYINKIYKDGLCLGCGLCEGVCGKDTVEMQLQKDGFFKPVIKGEIRERDIETISKVCPGLNVVNDIPFSEEERIWGRIEKLYSAFSTDNEIRTKGSSGGMISGIAIYLLENRLVDAVLQVGGDSMDYQRNELKISRSRQDVLSCASSRYAPALIFDKILQILDSSSDTFCFIGKPCDISALKNLIGRFPQYQDRIKLTLSIMCAGMPSFIGTSGIFKEMKATEPVTDLVYRGNGWPGYFSFKDKNDQVFQMTYNESWGKRLGPKVHNRCKICPDGIGLQADIAIGDAWETADGYPDFTEREGNSLVIARTGAGVQILKDMETASLSVYRDLSTESIGLMQPFQSKRRHRFAVRALAFSIAKKRRVNFQNVKAFSNARRLSFETMAREFWGMFKRAIK